ncbi:hypothetical protein [Streptacidiphilus fuscans]|uniref:Uncharacterized protein n=1 Tax=Streptacidiphilus fuscans TaxID=2789292 RepID=A0A931FB55_9ACTN|nr:hypothetical protein [Streptacidiphilus fuscans]MBF9067098.1 hypothetical protein [Streptacidiphilus fuscans]
MIGGPAATAASATTATPTVSIAGVTEGETLSGAVQVTATVTASSTTDPVTELEFDISGHGGITQDVPVPASGCASGCVVQWNLDTNAAGPGTAGAPGLPELQDGQQDLSVVALDAQNRALSWQDVSVQVDNHRPAVATDPARTSGWTIVSGNDQVLVHAKASTAADAPAGTSIAQVMLEIPSLGNGTVLQLTQSATDPTSWVGELDAGQIPAGYYPAMLVAVDSNGTVSGWAFDAEEHVEVEHGFTLTPDGTMALSTDPRQLRVDYTYPQWANARATVDYPQCDLADGYANAQQVQVQVDGTPWYAGAVTAGQLGQNTNGACVLQVVPAGAAAPQPLPVGRHVLTFHVTDSDGVAESLTEPVSVGARPLAVTWPHGAVTAVVGSTVHVSPTITSPDGFSRVQSWTYTYAGKTIASGSYPQAPNLTWTTPKNTAIAQALHLTVVTDSGQTTVSTVPLSTDYASGTTISASARQVSRGAWLTVDARVWWNYEGRWLALGPDLYAVRLEWAPPGSSAWRSVAYQNVNLVEKQPIAFHTRVWSPGCYRAVTTFTGTGEPFLPSTSSTVCVKL